MILVILWDSDYGGCKVNKLSVSACLASLTGILLLKDASVIPGCLLRCRVVSLYWKYRFHVTITCSEVIK